MKKILIIALALSLICSNAFAGWVNGYTRSNGTKVQGYNRSNANSTVRDNYSYKGNTNPHTGSTGSNYYRNNRSSEYYDGSSLGSSRGSASGNSNPFVSTWQQ